ncbi:MAG TPA: pitrilysin family protein [Polyangia bacterium]|jgi:predicted Zn-dependent peptidase
MPTTAVTPRQHVLSNGLRVITIELPHLHTVSLVMYAKVGSRYETPASNGLSHFVEHMLFRGTERYPDSYALHLAIEDFGGTLYAETGRDYSLYQIAVHPESVPSALEVLGEIFHRPRFPDVDLERKLVLEEMLEDRDEDGREINIDDISRAAVWPDHPLGFKITGPAGNVERFAERDVRRHFQEFYGAANMILCISGAASEAEVLPLVQQHFDGLHPGQAATPLPPPEDQHEARFVYVENQGSQTSVQVLLRGVAEQDPDFTALTALGRILDDGMSTRLHYRICDQLGLAYYCAANLEPLHDTALFEVDSTSAHAKVPALLREQLALLTALRDRPPTAAELNKAKRRYRWDLEGTFDDPDSLAGWFGGTALFYQPEGYAEKVRRMEAVTGEDIMRVARRIIQPARLTVAAVGVLDKGLDREVEAIVRQFR